MTYGAGRCSGCGAYYQPAAHNFLDDKTGGACLYCGEIVYSASHKPDYSDPWEIPVTKRQAVRLWNKSRSALAGQDRQGGCDV